MHIKSLYTVYTVRIKKNTRYSKLNKRILLFRGVKSNYKYVLIKEFKFISFT